MLAPTTLRLPLGVELFQTRRPHILHLRVQDFFLTVDITSEALLQPCVKKDQGFRATEMLFFG
jgi:hypothetical protein